MHEYARVCKRPIHPYPALVTFTESTGRWALLGLLTSSTYLHHSGLRHSLPNARPSPQRGTPYHLLTTSRVASITPLPPVPHTDGAGNGRHSAVKARDENSLPGLQKAAPMSLAGDTALHTQSLETPTHPPGDRPCPTANPTTGPKQGQIHADDRHQPRGKLAHTKTPHDRS